MRQMPLRAARLRQMLTVAAIGSICRTADQPGKPVESPPMQKHDSDVLILGGGVIGLACARYLLEAGRQVTILDQGSVGCGSSHGNCGTLTPSHATPLAMPGVIGTALR